MGGGRAPLMWKEKKLELKGHDETRARTTKGRKDEDTTRTGVHVEGGHGTGSPKRECWRSSNKGRAGPLDA